MRIDTAYLHRTLADLVRLNSINPAFSGGRTDERLVAACVADALRALGAEVTLHEPQPGRVSVTGRVRGTGGGPSLMLYAHHDTVGVEGMADPFSAEIRDGRMYGRGAYDMKCGLAACLAAVHALRGGGVRLAGDVVVCSVADEEVASIGISDVLTRVRTDAAIVTEPTELEVCVAHKGFAWLRVSTHGRAAHGSRYDEGVDANLRMGRFLSRLEVLERALRARAAHPLLGTPSLHAAVLRGGTGESTYAARCDLDIERRMLPAERDDDVVAEIRAILDELGAADPTFQGEVALSLSRPGWETPVDALIARAVRDAARRALGRDGPLVGKWYWMDTSLIAQAGIETIVFGPSGAGAHAAVEGVDLASVEQTAAILADAAVAYCGRAKESVA